MTSSALRVGLAAVALTLLASCAAESTPEPKVASLPGAETSTESSPADESGRPQLRLDSSDEEVQAAWQGYYVCLRDHGHRMLTGRGDEHAGPAGAPGVVSPDMNDESPQSLAAQKTCANKLPLQPPELDQDKNPNYLDDYHEYMTCLTDGGLKVHPIDPFGTGWTYDDGVTQTLPEETQQELEETCELEAFSA